MRTEPITLDLNTTRVDRFRALAALDFATTLLGIIGRHLPEHGSLGADAFRASLERHRHALADEGDVDALERVAQQCARDCDDFLARAKKHDLEREKELLDVVLMLHEVMEAVRGSGRDLDQGVTRSTERLQQAMDIEDIRELKRTLAREVEDLKQAVAEQRQRDETQYARLSKRVTTLEASLRDAHDEASRDPLTGVANRGTFDRTLVQWLECPPGVDRFVLALIDLDDFKKVNDEHGHLVGDRVLICAAQHVRQFFRPTDLVSRYGGEEFAVLFACPSLAQGRARFQELLAKLAPSYEYGVSGQTHRVKFSFSVGLTESTSSDTPESIIRRADEALYSAKRKGKHRVEVKTTSILQRLIG